MGSIETELAREVVAEKVKEGESTGRSGAELGGELERVGETLQKERGSTAQDVQTVTAEHGIVSDDRPIDLPADASDSLKAAAENPDVDLSRVGEIVKSTGTDIQGALGDTSTMQREGSAVGQAFQGVDGSSRVEVATAVKESAPNGTGSLVDKNELEDRNSHEDEHERQAQRWDAETVDIGNNQQLTRHKVSEVGSMNRQKSRDTVSDGYKDIWSEVTSVVSAGEAQEAARSGNLVELGNTVRRKRGLREIQQAGAENVQIA